MGSSLATCHCPFQFASGIDRGFAIEGKAHGHRSSGRAYALSVAPEVMSVDSARKVVATVSAVLTVGFSFDDEPKCMHLLARGRASGIRDLG